jgi:hypothetical protein
MASMAHERELHPDELDAHGGSLAAIEAKEQRGETLTLDDLSFLGKDLDADLHTTKTAQGFLGDNESLQAMMATSHMSLMQLPGKDGHTVLEIGDGHGGDAAIYDGRLRDEGQLVTDRKELLDYQQASAAPPAPAPAPAHDTMAPSFPEFLWDIVSYNPVLDAVTKKGS